MKRYGPGMNADAPARSPAGALPARQAVEVAPDEFREREAVFVAERRELRGRT